MPSIRVDSQLLREMNYATVLEVIRSRRVVSRIDLVRETGLSKATISDIIDHFAHEGFVRPLGPGKSKVGRRPMLLEFDPRARLVIGVELGNTNCTAILTDLAANPLRSLSRPVLGSSGEEAIATAGDLAAELAADVPAGTLLGVGVGTPGIVDPAQAVIRTASDVAWSCLPVASRLTDRLGTRVIIVNRAKAAALGETWCGAGQGVDDLVYVSVTTGLAAGIVINRRLYQGVSMSDGTLAHVTAVPDGQLCQCGNRGCLNPVAPWPAIVARIREKLRMGGRISLAGTEPHLITLDTVAEAVAAGDEAVLEVLREVAEHLGVALANVVNLFNPAMLVLGGSVVRALPTLVPFVESAIRRRAVPVSSAALQVVPSRLGPEAVPIGAAAHLLSHLSVTGGYALRVQPVGHRL